MRDLLIAYGLTAIVFALLILGGAGVFGPPPFPILGHG